MRRASALVAVVAVAGCSRAAPQLSPADVVKRDFADAPATFELPPEPVVVTVETDGVDVALEHAGVVVDRRAQATGFERTFAEGGRLVVRRAHAGTSTGTFTLRLAKLPARDERFDAERVIRAADARRWSHVEVERTEALALYRDAAGRFDAAGDRAMAAQAALRSAELAFGLGARDVERELRWALDRADPTIAGALRLQLSRLATRAGRLEEAKALRAEARSLTPDPLLRAWIDLLEAEARARTDQSAQAIIDLRRVLALAERAGDRRLAAAALAAIGWCHERLGERDEALAAFERGLEAARASGDVELLGVALHDRGIVHSNFDEDWAVALPWYLEAIRVRRKSGDRFGLAYSLDAAAEMESTLAQPVALERHAEALEIRRELGDLRGEAQTLILLGNGRRRLGDPAGALEPGARGAEIMRELGDRDWEGYAYFCVARAAHVLGRYDEAVAWIERALAITESLRQRIASDDSRAYYSDSVRMYFDQYVSAAAEEARRTGERRWLEKALTASEQARARSLLDMMTLIDAGRPRAGTELARRQEEAVERVRSLEQAQRLARARPAPREEIEARDRAIEAALAAYERLQVEIDAADPDSARLRRMPLVTLAEAEAMAGDDALIVEYYLGRGGAYAITVGTGTVAAWPLGPQAPIIEAARALHEQYSARNRTVEGETATARAERLEAADAASAKTARTLRGLLSIGLGAAMKDRARLVIVPDGALHYVPFGALWPEHEVVTLPSLSVLKAQRERERARPTLDLSIVGDPIFEGTDPRLVAPVALPDDERGHRRRLAHSRAESEAIAALVPEGRRLVFLGAEASKRRVLSGALTPFRIVHFATHGILDTQTPERSGLLLSRVDGDGNVVDDFLTLGDVYGLELSADLVTLSACETALGAEVRSEGLIGLLRGFLHAGARRVVASLWKVDDAATAQLMTAFYTGILKERLPPAEALRRAQRTLAADARYRAPYYWAGFVLQGD